MRTLLVTGGAGFIGSHLCDRLLAEGHRVVAVDDLTKGRIANLAEARTYGQQFTFEHVDIRSGSVRQVFEHHRPEVVMHLAAQTSVRAGVENPIHDASVNLLGLLNVLESAVTVGAKKVVFASSGGTIYGEPKKLPVKETARRGAHPGSPYGISKKAAEDYLVFYKRSRRLDFTALALANVYGPRQDPYGEAGVIAIFAAQMLKGETPLIFGSGEQTRDYVFVEDVVDAFARGADAGSGSLLNVGTGVETTVNELFRAMAKISGFDGEPVHAEARPGELLRSSLDVEQARSTIGWAPWTDLDHGLRSTIAWVRGG